MKRNSILRTVCVLGSLAGLAGCGAGNSEPQAASPATQAQALRIQDASPAAIAHMKAVVAPLVSRDFSNVRVVQEPNGSVRREFRSGFKNVVILHRGADGKNRITCVDNVDGVDDAMSSPRPLAVR